MRRLLAFLALTLALGACGAASSPTRSSGTGIEGRITVGPSCPVQRADSPCPDRPLSATVIIRDASGREIKRFTSGQDGAFRVALEPGTYTLDPQSPNVMPHAEPRTVTVAAGSYTRADIAYDSGIR